jgi:alanine-glyoxylate transaminase/serine-glyoxylate transaminase/serine-pyruvate transaminase
LGDVNAAMILGCLGGVEAALQALGIAHGAGGVARAAACLAGAHE